MTMKFPVEAFANIETPFYYYDVELLEKTLATVKEEAGKYEGFHVHYAIKANFNHRLLEIVKAAGLGADCVSGGEVQAALNAGITPDKVVFAGVGKTDKEIAFSLDNGIFCFNVESVPEIEAIEALAAERNIVAQVAIRINPNIGAHTHSNITTGLAENKFGINYEQLDEVIDFIGQMEHIKLIGLHFHIGSQILVMDDFIALCGRINELQELLYDTKEKIME